MRDVQVSRDVSRCGLFEAVETNLRLVEWADGLLECHAVRVESADRSPELRQKICSRLRAHNVVAVPRPGQSDGLLVAARVAELARELRGDGWHARLHPEGRAMLLDPDNPLDRVAAVELVQKRIATTLEQAGEYWWLSDSTRHWFGKTPVVTDDGIEMLPRFSFATQEVQETKIGVAIDFGHMFQTEQTVADFLKSGGGVARFNELRRRQDGHKGTLIYDLGTERRSKCYFSDFARGKTCSTTGVIFVGNRRYDSLYDYYRQERPELRVGPDELMIYVSFEGLGRPKPVAARLVKLRLQLDPRFLPRRLRQLAMAPQERKRRTEAAWAGSFSRAIKQLGGKTSATLWRPGESEAEQITPPDLLLGQGRVVQTPKSLALAEYQRYYREREENLHQGGIYRFEQTIPKELWFALPKPGGSWSAKLQDEFVRLLRDSLQDLTGDRFRLPILTAGSSQEIVHQLASREPSTVVVVFDPREMDGASYYLLSEQLEERQGWRLKRLTRRTLEEAWRRKEEACDAQSRAQADRYWRDVVFHSVLDVLDQMDAVPWRIGQWAYDACLAIDVAASRRYYGLALLVCRDPQKFPGAAGYLRIVDSWPKPEVNREAINAAHLEDRIAELAERITGHRFPELESLLVLRDGDVYGQELPGIERGLSRLMQAGVLAQFARTDVVGYHKRTVKDLRMWCSAREVTNVLEGRAAYLGGNAALLSCTGAATLPRNSTAEPCLLVGQKGSDIRRAAAGVFALAQHNYLSPKKAYRDAQPIRDLDRELERRVAMEVRGLR
jgi:hypothetical protein